MMAGGAPLERQTNGAQRLATKRERRLALQRNGAPLERPTKGPGAQRLATKRERRLALQRNGAPLERPTKTMPLAHERNPCSTCEGYK
jgi:hypothetical protein